MQVIVVDKITSSWRPRVCLLTNIVLQDYGQNWRWNAGILLQWRPVPAGGAASRRQRGRAAVRHHVCGAAAWPVARVQARVLATSRALRTAVLTISVPDLHSLREKSLWDKVVSKVSISGWNLLVSDSPSLFYLERNVADTFSYRCELSDRVV